MIVSGIAQGIDSHALKGALAGGGTVVSVLAGGIDKKYPWESRFLYDDVAAAGALISEYPPGTPHKGMHFPIRNRIISGLSDGVIAVEGQEKGGTMITMDLALEQNRDTFAVPGPADAPMSAGTNRLIRMGWAKLVTSAADVLSEYEGRRPLRRPCPRTRRKRTGDWKPPCRPPGKQPAHRNPLRKKWLTRRKSGHILTGRAPGNCSPMMSGTSCWRWNKRNVWPMRSSRPLRSLPAACSPH